MSASLSCVVVAGTSSIPAWQISSGDAGARTAIGSDSTVAWQFASHEVQPRHAELYFDGAALYVCDLVNQGDVSIGGAAVTAGQWVPVPIGSELRVGQAKIQVTQGASQSLPPPVAQSSAKQKGRKQPPQARVLVIGAIVVVGVLVAGGIFAYKKFRASASQQAGPVTPAVQARTRPRGQSADHLFPATETEIRTRDDFSKRTDPDAKEKVEKKRKSTGSSTLLERPEPTTLEGKAAAAAIDGDPTTARELYGQLVTENPSNKAFRVALEIIERERLERCRLRGDKKCE